MPSLQTLLEQDHSRKTKAEITEMLTNLRDLIGTDIYASVSGIDPATELPDLAKKDMLEVVDDFKQAYSPDWDKRVDGVPIEIVARMFNMAPDELEFSAANASDADFPNELNNIDFASLIGGPMQAAVEAQNKASIATVNFIKEVGFEGQTDTDDGKLRMVEFKFKKNVPNPNFDPSVNGSEPTIEQDAEITVPFISLLNVPALRVQTLDIDFNVKLNSAYTNNKASSFGANASVSGGWGPVKMKVSASYRRSTFEGTKVEKEYSMNVKVKALNDEIPRGLELVLNGMLD